MTSRRRASLAAVASLVVAGLAALAPAAQAAGGATTGGAAFGPEVAHARSHPPIDPTGSTPSTLSAAQGVVNAEVQAAGAALATSLRQPHAGQPESLTHPAGDTANAAVTRRRPGRPQRAEPNARTAATAPLSGLDVASYQGNVNWAYTAAQGAAFAYTKASEGTYYTNPFFAQQYQGSYRRGLVRGAYHFAIPNNSTGAAQADFFVAHGGAWSPDHQTLPGMLDIEYNPYGPTCYGLTPAQMVGWIGHFVNEYHARTGRWAVIYTTAGWWGACTANFSGFAANDPLFIANYSSSPFPLAAGWPYYTLWQYSDQGRFPGDQDLFNGSAARLVALADAGQPPAPGCLLVCLHR